MIDLQIYSRWAALGFCAVLALPIVASALPSGNERSGTESTRNIEGGRAIAALNRAQQSYYFENSRFSSTFKALDAGVPRATQNYLHLIKLRRSSPVHYAITYRPNLKSFVGRVIRTTLNGSATSRSIICESETFGRIVPPSPVIDNELKLGCAPGTQEWTVSTNATPEELNNQGRTTVAMMNRSQQAYFLENSRFSTTLTELELFELPSKIAYDYSVQPTSQFTVQYGVSRRSDVKSYVGAVVLVLIANGEETSFSVLCEAIQAGPFRPAAPIIIGNNQAPVCAAGTQSVTP